MHHKIPLFVTSFNELGRKITSKEAVSSKQVISWYKGGTHKGSILVAIVKGR